MKKAMQGSTAAPYILMVISSALVVISLLLPLYVIPGLPSASIISFIGNTSKLGTFFGALVSPILVCFWLLIIFSILTFIFALFAKGIPVIIFDIFSAISFFLSIIWFSVGSKGTFDMTMWGVGAYIFAILIPLVFVLDIIFMVLRRKKKVAERNATQPQKPTQTTPQPAATQTTPAQTQATPSQTTENQTLDNNQ